MKNLRSMRMMELTFALAAAALWIVGMPACAQEWTVYKTEVHAGGLTLQADKVPAAPKGKALVMTVDGVETPLAAGAYSGKVVLEVIDGAETDLLGTGDSGGQGSAPGAVGGAMPMSAPGGEAGGGAPGGGMNKPGPGGGTPGVPGGAPGGNGDGIGGAMGAPPNMSGSVYRSALFVEKNAVVAEKSATSILASGKYDGKAMSGVSIQTQSPNFNGVTIVNQEYAIDELKADISGDGGADITGVGSAIAAFQGSKVNIIASKIVTHGTARSAVFAGSEDINNPVRVSIKDSVITAYGNIAAVPASVWLLGVYGDVRPVQFVGYFDNAFDHVTIKSSGWAVLSVDKTKPPTKEFLTKSGMNAAYDEKTGYGARLPHEMLNLYAWTAKNTVNNSLLSVLSEAEGGWGDGYGVYALGANLNTFDHTKMTGVSYGAILANEYASVAFVNGTELDSSRFGIYAHSNKGGVIYVDHSTVNTKEAVFLLKAVNGGLGHNSSMIEVNHSKINNTGDGIVLLMMDNDVPGRGTVVYDKDGKTQIDQRIDIKDNVAVKDAKHDVIQEYQYEKVTYLRSDAEYMSNVNDVAYFTDCNGENAINGDFYNSRTLGQNITLHFDHTQVEGVISSGTTAHNFNAILKNMKRSEAIYEKDGVRYANRNNLGKVSVAASKTVNNGVIVYLEGGSQWKVRNTSYISKLFVSADSTVEGKIQAESAIKSADGATTYTGVVVGKAL